MTVKRITLLQELLAFIGLPGRLRLEWISSAEAQKFVKVVSDFTAHIRDLGPNPLKSKRMRLSHAAHFMADALKREPLESGTVAPDKLAIVSKA
jgi:F420-non-reducing hydrogenase iron-sulfur subunit